MAIDLLSLLKKKQIKSKLFLTSFNHECNDQESIFRDYIKAFMVP